MLSFATDAMTGKQQLVAFEETDVLVAVHGSVVTNIIFMLPHSALIELFPPKYSYTCFYRLSLNDKIDYTKIKGYVEQDPVCPPGTRCGVELNRDVDFMVKVEDVTQAVKSAVKYVRERKYV